jgi:hypothetical protein
MKSRILKLSSLALAAALSIGATSTLAVAQAKQDMKEAGHDTKDAAKDTGHGVKTGTEKGYDKTKSGTKKVFHKTKSGTKKAYHKTVKTLDPHANSQDANHQ